MRIAALHGHALQVPRGAQHEAVAGVVHGIGEHGDAAGPPTADDLHQGEGQVDEEGGAEGRSAGGGDVAVGVLGMVVVARVRMRGFRVLVRHASCQS